jgi:hypothetical protein
MAATLKIHAHQLHAHTLKPTFLSMAVGVHTSRIGQHKLRLEPSSTTQELLCVLQVGQLKGFSYTSKDRWVVIAPRFTPPPPGGSVGEVRVMMLLFRNAAEADPRTKAWLDGAAISMAGGEALLVSLDGNGVSFAKEEL